VQTTSLNPLASVEFENNNEASGAKKSVVSDQPSMKSDSVQVKIEVVPPVENDIYSIIAGSFKSESNAALLIRKLTDEGYAPEIISAPNGFFRVSVMKCSNMGQAVQKKDSIGKKYTGTWITKIK
jgi:hypothetical protein